jgi:hypothetical protein
MAAKGKGAPPAGKDSKPPSGKKAQPPSSPKSGSPTPPSGAGGPPGSGGAPGGGSSTAVTGTGAYQQDGAKATKSEETITASQSDESGILVNKSATLVLKDVTVKTTGSSSSSDDSSFYGLDAGVLALNASRITDTGGSVTTTGDGANGVFSYGSGSSISISGATIKDSGQYAHGIMASGGGNITATDLNVSTKGASSAAVATDRGGGTILVEGGTFRTAGGNSPGVYSTGTITLTGATFEATGAEAAVIEGSNSIVATNSRLTGTVNRGVMIYQSMSGDAQGQAGTYTQTAGSLVALSGPLFYVTNTTATIKLSHVKTSESSGMLLDAAAGNWGNAGSNGGSVTLTALDQQLDGNVVADETSTVKLVLGDSSGLIGAVNTAGNAKEVKVSLDKSSKWTVTASSHVTVLEDPAGVSRASVTNIIGNGHDVYYVVKDNPLLGGKTYQLAGGGELIPS